MRLFWSVVLAGGLILVGVDVYESQKTSAGDVEMSGRAAEDGTGYPEPPPPPPPR
jgi:hypothetical protein